MPPSLVDKKTPEGTNERSVKMQRIPLGFSLTADGGDGEYHPLLLDSKGRLITVVDGFSFTGDVIVELSYVDDEVQTLPGDATEGASKNNPSLTIARNSSNFITTLTKPEWGGTGATKTYTRNSSNFITSVSAWV